MTIELAIMVLVPILILAEGIRNLHRAIFAYLILLPLIYISIPIEEMMGRSISYDKLAIIALSVAFLAGFSRLRHVISLSGLSTTIRLWLVYLGIVWGVAFVTPLPISQQLWGLSEKTFYFILFLAFMRTASDYKGRASIMQGALWGGGILIIILIGLNGVSGRLFDEPVLNAYKSHPQFPFHLIDTRFHISTGALGQPNYLAGYLLLLFPMMSLMFRQGNKLQYATMLLLVGYIGLIFYASSLGGIVGLVIGVVLLGVMIGRAGAPNKEGLKKTPILFLLILIILLTALVSSSSIFSRSYRSFEVRYYVHRVATMAIVKKPFLGHGIDSFEETFAITEKEFLFDHNVPPWRRGSEGQTLSSHSSFLRAFVETGLAGGFAFLILIAGTLVKAARRLRETNAFSWKRFEAWAWAGCVGFFAQSFTEELFSFPKTAVLFWGMVALCLTSTSKPQTGVTAQYSK